MKKIILCADDYAQNNEISQGILTLVNLDRLAAVSCMTHTETWPMAAKELHALAQQKNKHSNKLDVGLHFDLGNYQNEQSWSFNQLILNAMLGRINASDIAKHLNQQLDDFETHYGQVPNFVDGHQHVHSFPNIRTTFLQTLHSRYSKNLPYLRLSNPPLRGHDTFIKALTLKLLALGFAQEATRLGFRYPNYFNGAYSLRPANYRELFQGWLKHSHDNTLIMCHPGESSNDLNDPIRNARPLEMAYLASDEFLNDLANNQAQLSNFEKRKRN